MYHFLSKTYTESRFKKRPRTTEAAKIVDFMRATSFYKILEEEEEQLDLK